MPYLASLFAAAAVFSLGVAMLAICIGIRNRGGSEAAGRLRLAAAAIMAAGACFGLVLAVIGVVAQAHGAEPKAFKESSWLRLNEMNILSHAVETKAEPEPNQLFIYVRYGCKDCMAVSEELEEAIEASGLPFAGWYSTRTDIGRRLLEKYPVEMVPMLVWLDADGWAETCDPVAKNDDGSIYYNAAAVSTFFKEITRDNPALTSGNAL